MNKRFVTLLLMALFLTTTLLDVKGAGNTSVVPNRNPQGYLLENITLYRIVKQPVVKAEETQVFLNNEDVVAVISVGEPLPGKKMWCSFSGPNNTQYEEVVVLGEKRLYSCTLPLSKYPPGDVVGLWNLTVHLGDETLTKSFFVGHASNSRRNSQISELVLSKEMKAGRPSTITESFLSTDKVYSWIEIKDSSQGDEIVWVFRKSEGGEFVTYHVLKQGETSCYAVFELSKLRTEESVGNWSVEVYLNGKRAPHTKTFMVSPLGGFNPWASIVTLLMILGTLIVVFAAITRRPSTS